MQRPLFLLLLSTLSYASEAATNASAWNCEQSKDGKEWVCSGDTNLLNLYQPLKLKLRLLRLNR